MEEIKNKLKETKLKLLDVINKKLEDKTISTEDLRNISMTFSNIITYNDYLDKIYTGNFGFGGCATSEDKINIDKGE